MEVGQKGNIHILPIAHPAFADSTGRKPPMKPPLYLVGVPGSMLILLVISSNIRYTEATTREAVSVIDQAAHLKL